MMTDKMPSNIPTLDNVVEIGAAAEDEDIRIVADKDDGMEDVYDEEFKKLFEPAQEPATIELADVDPEASDEEIWDDSAMQMVEEEPPVTEAPAADEDLGDISITAVSEPAVLDEGADSEDDMWLQDWQEEIVETAVIDDMDRDLEISHVPTATTEHPQTVHDLAEATEPVEPVPASTEPGDRQTGTVAAMADAIQDEDDISALVNDIVGEIMPEIEWKLRTRIRDILEQRFVDDD